MFPLIRILIALCWVVVPISAIQGILRPFQGQFALARDLFVVTLAFGLYVLFVRVVERRTPNEIDPRFGVRETALGFGGGIALMSVVIGTLALLGHYHIVGHNDRNVLWGVVAMAIVSGFLEELFLRAIVFRISEEGVGTIAAIVLSSLLFGFLHYQNPNATVISSVAIALEAGTLLAAAYLWRRRLWLAIGIHAGWNFAQSGVFGVPVSGIKLKGVFIGQLSGPEVLTGGAFGPEAGLVALIVCLCAFAYVLGLAMKREPLRIPAWLRGQARID